jgi:hypothetical protein
MILVSLSAEGYAPYLTAGGGKPNTAIRGLSLSVPECPQAVFLSHGGIYPTTTLVIGIRGGPCRRPDWPAWPWSIQPMTE